MWGKGLWGKGTLARPAGAVRLFAGSSPAAVAGGRASLGGRARVPVLHKGFPTSWFVGLLCGLFLTAFLSHVEAISHGARLSVWSNPLRIIEFIFARGASSIALSYSQTAGRFPDAPARFCRQTTFGTGMRSVIVPAQFQASWQRS